jgi:ABC-type taurine transport system ATPase subunit
MDRGQVRGPFHTLAASTIILPMTDDPIRIRGARQHNLKNFDLDLPRRRLTVVTGPSGSGKSSLALDTLFAEGQRRYGAWGEQGAAPRGGGGEGRGNGRGLVGGDRLLVPMRGETRILAPATVDAVR